MEFEWKYTIGDVCFTGDGAHSKVKRIDEGIPYLTSKNIGQGKLKLDDVDCISEESFEKLFPLNSKAIKRPQVGDVLIGIIGTFGNSYIYKKTDKFGFSSSIGILRPKKTKILSKYLYYVINSSKFKAYNKQFTAGSVQGYTNISTVKSLPIPLQSLDKQQKIASILSSLDDKIELNNKVNQTLEKMAQTIFKEWFEEFNFPDTEGKPYKTNGGAMHSSELGEIPEGWEVATLGNLGKVVTGKTPSTQNKEYWGDILDFITPTDFKYYGKYTTNSDRSLSLLGIEKIKNNVLPKNSILVTCIGSDMGKVTISQSKCITNQQINSLVIDNLIMLEYIYQYIKYSYALLRSIAMGGTTMPIINKTDFQNIEIILPSSDLIEEFHNITYSFNEQIKQNQQQTQTLTKLRDTLLPKLMSGELKV